MTDKTETLYENLRDYDFDTDEAFQFGLRSVMEFQKGKSETEVEAAVEKAKFFYYSKCVQKVDYKGYLQWKAKQDAASKPLSDSPTVSDTVTDAATETTDAGPDYPRSFQEICELIASGKPIPGIKQIPNKLSETAPSEATMKPRPKPWEKR
ncbi:hypothetical protein K7432_006683 [Basidiobolus ranarum]|uniref:Uncharacterized protein n=1 Tax=Basidiobolus ranarum TaxID=34480 RepID=A0ABR2WUJ0_9FUNG